MKFRAIVLLLVTTIGLCQPPPVAAWGQLGHAVIGSAALAQAQPATRAGVATLLGVPTEDGHALAAALDTACSWPDAVRETAEWAWSAPLHYVNIPRDTDRYDRQRDCPEGLCVTEALARYVAELDRSALDAESSWQAFAWVCHLVGDLHQPLHAGLLEDRGGNRIEVRHRGETWNLHEWWDDVLPAERLVWQPGMPLPGWMLPLAPAETRVESWLVAEIVAWTEESHALALERAYPPGPVIDEDFADASWRLAMTRWQLAAARLARILDWVWEQPSGLAAN